MQEILASSGNFYRPDFEFNNIPCWFVDEGYQIKMTGAAELTLEGMSVLRDEPIPLESGWQLISYYPRFPINAALALSGITDHLLIAKDGYGNFYLPEWDFSNMGDMREGQGYYVNVDQDIELVYNTGREAAFSTVDDRLDKKVKLLPSHPVTGSNMSLLIFTDPPLRSRGGMKGGVEIGVYASGELIGSGVLQNGVCGIAVWGDDPTTDLKEGASKGESIELKIHQNGNLNLVEYTILAGKAVYQTDSYSVFELKGSLAPPEEFGIVSIYPNPFNAFTRVDYCLLEDTRVSLKLFDLRGRLVLDLFDAQQKAGRHHINLDGGHLASGVYLMRLETAMGMSQRKIILLK